MATFIFVMFIFPGTDDILEASARFANPSVELILPWMCRGTPGWGGQSRVLQGLTICSLNSRITLTEKHFTQLT